MKSILVYDEMDRSKYKNSKRTTSLVALLFVFLLDFEGISLWTDKVLLNYDQMEQHQTDQDPNSSHLWQKDEAFLFWKEKAET